MDSTTSGTRSTRARAKAASLSEEAPPAAAATATEPEAMPPNVNGNKDGGGGEESKPSTLAAVEEDVAQADGNDTDGASSQEDGGKPRAARKRKLTEEEEDEEQEQPTQKQEPEAENNDDVEETANKIKEEFEEKESTIGIVKAETKDDEQAAHTANTEESGVASADEGKQEDAITPMETSYTETKHADDINTLNTSSGGGGGESYGKGKRARVPNKRYSDIVHANTRSGKYESPRPPKTTQPSQQQSSPKNGELPSDDLDEILREEFELEQAKKPKASVKSDPEAEKKKTLKKTALLKPFKFGWRRELVVRSTLSNGKRIGDIYYFMPDGRKLRSMREVAQQLKPNGPLSMENFSYTKELIGANEPDEIIRDANWVGAAAQAAAKKQAAAQATASSPAGKGVKRLKPTSSTSTTPVAPSKMAKTSKSSPFKVKAPVKTTPSKKVKQAASPPPAAHNSKKMKTSRSATDRRKSATAASGQCSVRCEGANGEVPTLQCRICLCLYHNVCLGMPAQLAIASYVCKNCEMDVDESVVNPITQPPPPPTQHTHPKSDNADAQKKSHANSESLVGALTTWFPSSSTIRVGGAADCPPGGAPQLVEYVGNKKYIVVPRHNILSVRGSQQAVAKAASLPSTEPDLPALSRTPSPSPDEKVEPPPKPTPTKLSLRHKTESKSPASTTLATQSNVPANFMTNYMQNLQFGYATLIYVFQYLKVQDLLRAGCVCTMWRDMSRSPALWKTVRMKNSQVHSFEGMASTLKEHGTVHLDLRKMLLPPSATNGDDIWPLFTDAIKEVDTLRRIELCRCLASVVEDLARHNHNLEVINAVTIKCESMTFEPFANLSNLYDLRLKSTSGLKLTSDLSALKALTKLRHLSITSIKDLNQLNIDVFGELVNLEVLELGECAEFPAHFGPDILARLTKLERLRLEKGQGECHTFAILEAVRNLPALHQLELVNFDIKSGFDKALGTCFNLKKLLLIPTYISQSATTNHMVLGGVLRLQKSLSHFVWGVTLELLRVTELFVDQCEHPDRNKDKGMHTGDSIPVLKPVPLHGIQQSSEASTPTVDTPQVEILPLPNLQKLLLQNLPTTRVKILKIPFHATWRQSINDSVN